MTTSVPIPLRHERCNLLSEEARWRAVAEAGEALGEIWRAGSGSKKAWMVHPEGFPDAFVDPAANSGYSRTSKKECVAILEGWRENRHRAGARASPAGDSRIVGLRRLLPMAGHPIAAGLIRGEDPGQAQRLLDGSTQRALPLGIAQLAHQGFPPGNQGQSRPAPRQREGRRRAPTSIPRSVRRSWPARIRAPQG
ncbi:MAG TPA: hypothetical protein VE684_00150 [Crenalkalicoccus sp.]|nr:hypothetical protein [Crenalkalicoccus sp.]